MKTAVPKNQQLLNTYFTVCTRPDLLATTKVRRFETKIGERVQVAAFPNDLERSLEQSSAKFVVFGIPEDVGVKANYGLGGTDTAWVPFLTAFLNIQSNDFLEGSNILLLGHFDFSDLSNLIEAHAHNYDERIDAYRHAVYTVDEAVEPLIKLITQYKKIPIIIGGGHNNAYPIICLLYTSDAADE